MSEIQLHREQPASLWRDNPMLVHLLGITPLMAVSDSATKALALGLGLVIISLLTALSLWGLRQFLQAKWRYLWIGLTLAAYTSGLALVIELNFFALYRELGIYIFLIAGNLALVIKMEAYLSFPRWDQVLLDSTKLGLSLCLALLGFALLRELLLAGTVFHNWELLLPGTVGGPELLMENRNTIFPFGLLQPVGFILLGLCVALLRLSNTQSDSPPKHRNNSAVKRARVTGRLKNLKEN